MNVLRGARAGFSLIEIVIAVTIMAIIAALVVPNVTSYYRKARVKATHVALANVQNALQSFHADTGTYPTTLSELRVRPADEKVAKRWEGPYLSNDPVDGFRNEIQYTVNPKGVQPPYELYSWGSQGEGSAQEEWIHAGEE